MKLSRGFTVIELIVVIAVFMLIVGATTSLFISMIQQQKRILAEQELLNQISYAEEYISKALRMAKTATTPSDIACLGEEGYIYLLTRFDSISGLYRGIRFINQSNNDGCQEFFLDTANPNSPVLKEIKNNGSAVALTSSALKINYVKFGVNGYDGIVPNCSDPQPCGATNRDFFQPKVTILLNVKIAGSQQEPDRVIQTTVSQRNLIEPPLD